MRVTQAKLSEKVQRPVRSHRRLLGISGLVVMGTLAAACGSSASSTTTSGGGGGGTAAPAATAAMVKTTTSSKLGTFLVDSKGFTLYRLNKDSTNKSVCTAACAKVWPPLLMTGSGSPVAGSGVTGLGTIKVSGGQQVTYHGMPLYTFVGDKSAGQATGQDLKDTWGTWFAIVTKASTAPTTSTPAGGATTTTGGGSGGVGF